MSLISFRNVVGLAGGGTAGAGVVGLWLMNPPALDWSPFLYVAAVALVVAAAAGGWDLATRYRARRLIASFHAEGLAMADEGYFQTADRRLLADAYDVFEGDQ
ncbi:MAG: hypothetical protein ABR585_07385 [Gemmatimonadaceae bacterium]